MIGKWCQLSPCFFGCDGIDKCKNNANHLYKEWPKNHDPNSVNIYTIIYRDSGRSERNRKEGGDEKNVSNKNNGKP